MVIFGPKNLSQICSFHLLLVLATEYFFSCDIFYTHSDNFLGCQCVVGMLTVHGSTNVLILFFILLKFFFFVFILDAIFCDTIYFFVFEDTLWLVKSLSHLDVFFVVPFISSTGLAIVAEANLRCGDFLSDKSCHKLVVSTSFWSWLLSVSSVLTYLKYTATIFRVVNALWVC